MARKLSLVALVCAGALALLILLRFLSRESTDSDFEPPSPRPGRLVSDRLPFLEPVDLNAGPREPAAEHEPVATRVIDDWVGGWFGSRSVALEARCIDPDGRPLAGVELTATQSGFTSNGRSDARGWVRLERNVAWFDWALSFEAFVRGRKRRYVSLFKHGVTEVDVVGRKEGYAGVKTSVYLVLGETVQLGDLPLYPAGSISGHVQRSNGSPAVGAGVSAYVHLGPRPEGFARVAPQLLETYTSTDEQGRFRLEGVAAGLARVAASTVDSEAVARAVEVRSGVETAGIALALHPRAAKEEATPAFAGRVLSPAGEPVARARVYLTVPWGGFETRSSGDGTFELNYKGRSPGTIDAWDETGRLGCARLEDVVPGEHDLVLRLDEGRVLSVEAVRSDGAKLRSFGASLFLVEERTEFEDARSRLHAYNVFLWPVRFASRPLGPDDGGQPVSLAIPRCPFGIEVSAEDCLPTVLGPFDPTAAPDEVHVVLEPAPQITGQVTMNGEPVPGARALLCRPFDGGKSIDREGFPSRYEVMQLSRTDARGAFSLAPYRRGPFVVRVESDRSAPAEIGPLTPRAEDRHLRIDVALTRGGDLEGEVMVDPGCNPAGVVVGISRGDGFALTQRTDREGRFRFEYLMPGPWFVHEHDDEIVPGPWGSNLAEFGPDEQWPTSRQIVEGRTTFLRLDLRKPPSLVLRGGARSDGRGLAGWHATLGPESYGIGMTRRSWATAVLAQDGSFELSVPGTGVHRLVLSDSATRPSECEVFQRLDLMASGIDWLLEFETGTLEGTVVPRRADVCHLVRASNGAFVRTRIDTDSSGRFRLERAPAGRGAIAIEPPLSFAIDPSTWESLAEIDVPPGGVASVTLP